MQEIARSVSKRVYEHHARHVSGGEPYGEKDLMSLGGFALLPHEQSTIQEMTHKVCSHFLSSRPR